MNVDFKRLLGLKYSDKDHQYKKDVSLVESIQFLKMDILMIIIDLMIYQNNYMMHVLMMILKQ